MVNWRLGKTANHADVVAQLMVVAADGSSYTTHGPHSLVMKIREMDSHRTLKEIFIGGKTPCVVRRECHVGLASRCMAIISD